MQQLLLKDLEKQIGKKCFLCNEFFTSNDFDEIEELQINYPIDEIFNRDDGIKPICQECYVVFFEKKYFSGDYNLFHPNEKADDFEDHEDFEPRD
jgi:hypothetical protein